MRSLNMGLNCASARSNATYVQALSNCVEGYVSAHPNAGLPNELGIRSISRVYG